MAKPSLLRHPKFLLLVRMLRMPKAHVLGHLEMMWHTAYDSGHDILGNSEHVEAAADWQGKPGRLTEALLSCGGEDGAGFIEPAGRGRFRIHDLYSNAPRYVKEKRERSDRRGKKSLSEVRREAAETRWSMQTDANAMQTDANGDHLHDCDKMQMHASEPHLHANGAPPLPSPTKRKKERRADRPDARSGGRGGVGEEEDGPPRAAGTAKPPVIPGEPERLSRLLYELIQAHGHNLYPREPNFATWSRVIDIMIRIDKRTPEEVEGVIRWVQANDFWMANALSPTSIRKNWAQIVMQMKRKGKADDSKKSPEDYVPADYMCGTCQTMYRTTRTYQRYGICQGCFEKQEPKLA